MNEPVVPDYGGACLSSVVPTLLARAPAPWLPADVAAAERIVLLVLDGLGWEQLQERRALMPFVSAMAGGPITSVAPSTTAAALTSISTGVPPGEHGLIGYRVHVPGSGVLNTLRWLVDGADAREKVPPLSMCDLPAFGGAGIPVITRAEFSGSGFSSVIVGGNRFVGYRLPSSIAVEVRAALAGGDRFVYAYYDGIDRIAHLSGLEKHYDAELATADRIVADIASELGPGCALVVTADHGQVHVGRRLVQLDAAVQSLCAQLSGEGRFRWLHAQPGAASELEAAARDLYADRAWVCSAEEVVAAGWLGPKVSDAARARLGDVALVARAPVAFADPADPGEANLVSRHGSLTSAEMFVPLLAVTSS